MLTQSIERSPNEIIEPTRAFPLWAATGLADVVARKVLVREREPVQTTERPLSKDDVASLGKELSEAWSQQVSRQLQDLQTNSKSPSLLNNAGVAFLNQGLHEEAIRYFKRARNVNPHFVPARVNLVRALVAARDLAGAQAEGEQLVKEGDSSTLVLSALADVYSALGDHERAINLYSTILDAQRDYSTFYNRGVQFLLSKRFREAISDFRQALSVYPRMAAAYNSLGVCFLLQRSMKKAIRNFEISVNLDPAPDSVRNLANALLTAKQSDKAMELLEQHLGRFPRDRKTSELLAETCRSQRRHRQCIRLLAGLIEWAEQEEPASLPRLYNNLGVVLGESGDVDGGVHYLESSQRLQEDYPIPFRNLARLLLAHRRLNRASNLYAQYGHRFNDAFSHGFGARLEELNGNYRQAEELYRQAIQSEPNNVIGYAGLSMNLCEANGDYLEAIEVLREGLAHCEQDLTLRNNLAYAHLMADQHREAREILDGTEEGDAAFYLWATRGLLLIKEGNVEEGASLYNRAEKLAREPREKKLVQQKKRIELARYWLAKGNTRKAHDLVTSALQIRTNEEIYRLQAERLLRLIAPARDQKLRE
jgi:tetratricopeptide (TPR) repeat protein